jgi:hypothetical protein
MRCSKVERELAPYLDGLLTAADERAIEAHVADCPSCRAALGDMRAAHNVLRALTPIRAPASFAPRVKAIARDRLQRTWCPPLIGRETRAALLAAAAVLVGGVLASSYISRPRPYVGARTASVASWSHDFGDVAAVGRVSESSDDESRPGRMHVGRPAPRPRPVVRLVSTTAPAGPVHAGAPDEPADAVAPAETDVGEAPPTAETPAEAAPRPTTMLAALDARLLEISSGPLTSRSAAVPAVATGTPREPRAETDVPETEVVSTAARVGAAEPRLAFAGHPIADADATVSFAALLSTQPLPSPADMSF